MYAWEGYWPKKRNGSNGSWKQRNWGSPSIIVSIRSHDSEETMLPMWWRFPPQVLQSMKPEADVTTQLRRSILYLYISKILPIIDKCRHFLVNIRSSTILNYLVKKSIFETYYQRKKSVWIIWFEISSVQVWINFYPVLKLCVAHQIHRL